MAILFRNTQQYAPAAGSSPKFRGTQQAVQVLAPNPVATIQNTQQYAQALAEIPNNPLFQATQGYAEGLADEGDGTLRITAGNLQVLAYSTLDFCWTHMLKKIRFPTGLSDGSNIISRRLADSQRTRSGARAGLSYWDENLRRFDVAKGIDTAQQMLELETFHQIVEGPTYTFFFRNPWDYRSSGFIGQDIQPTTNTDQTLGIGDNTTTVFQTIKTYTYDDGENPVASAVKTIHYPIASTYTAAVDGSTVTNYTLNTSGGTIRFNARASLARTDISFESSSGRNIIMTTGGDFSVFNVGNVIQIQGSTVNATASTSADFVHTITSVDASVIRITGAGSTFTTEAAGGTITVNTHPAPRSGEVVSAGFWYDTVCAFESMDLPLTLSQYNIGETRVVIEEVRVQVSC
jgi:uncharacterized protein (TIGR02217 family)